VTKSKESVLVSRSHKEIYVQMSQKMYRKFMFDRIFNDSSRNDEIFESCCQTQVDRFLNGYNATLFVYGQSGTGNLP
jgi:kinesin family protein 5